MDTFGHFNVISFLLAMVVALMAKFYQKEPARQAVVKKIGPWCGAAYGFLFFQLSEWILHAIMS